MQVRLDHDIADKVLRNTQAYRRMHKRRRSFSAEVNLMLRDYLFENGSVPIKNKTGKDEIRSMTKKARIISGWGNQPAKNTP